MIVKQFKGHGRRATIASGRRREGWLFRLFMAWFARGSSRRSG